MIVADDISAIHSLGRRKHLVLEGQVTQQEPLLSLFCTARTARFYETDLRGPWSLSPDCVGHLSICRVSS